MDLIGDIVEKSVDSHKEEQAVFSLPTHKTQVNRKPSRWKERLKKKNINSFSSTKNSQFDSEIKGLENNSDELTEKEKIHLENLKYFASLSPEQLAHEKEELMASIDPKLLNTLMRKANKGDQYLAEKESKNKEEVTSIKGETISEKIIVGDPESANIKEHDNKELTAKKTVRFKKEDSVKDIEPGSCKQYNNDHSTEDERVPTEQELDELNSTSSHDLFAHVHFPKNPVPANEEDIKLDLNDPEFLDKMHEKYFPDLPKETEKLKWMEPVGMVSDNVILDCDELRFDFNGNIMTPDPSIVDKIPTTSGLYHHSDNPELPGYTLKELAKLAISTFNAQRCISIRTIGRILHKLGLHKYDIEDENETNTLSDNELKTSFETKLWNQVIKLQIISILLNSADENLTRNISVRNYAIDALWLWRRTGADEVVRQLESSMDP